MTRFTKEMAQDVIASDTMQALLEGMNGAVTLEVRDEPLAIVMTGAQDNKAHEWLERGEHVFNAVCEELVKLGVEMDSVTFAVRAPQSARLLYAPVLPGMPDIEAAFKELKEPGHQIRTSWRDMNTASPVKRDTTKSAVGDRPVQLQLTHFPRNGARTTR